MMDYLSLLFSVLMLTGGVVGSDDDICFDVCKCTDGVIDCNSSSINGQPKLKDRANKTVELNLDYNNIRKVLVFEPSSTLSNISLNHNRISSIEGQAFESLYNITTLDLSHNILTSEVLKPILFKGPETSSGVSNLKVLKPILFKGPETSSGVSNLKVLNLASNALHTVHQNLFEFLPDLEELYLGSNPFVILDHGTLVALSSVHKIKVLDLSSTKISTVPSQWLNAAKNLEVLNLSMNNLTTVPSSLSEARGLRHLILNDNPITIISSFPKLTTLEILELNWMPKLFSIKAHSMVNLYSLKKLRVTNNHYLVEISEDTLIEPGRGGNESAEFPPIEVLELNDNRLKYLEEGLLKRWDKLKVLNLESNPWICDCKNQWMLSRLIPIMGNKQLGSPETLICGAPVEMKGMAMIELSMKNYKMRCLDLYGNEPDRDAKVLIVVLVIVLISIPISLLFLHLIKRPRGRSGHLTAYYRRALSFESINN